MAVTAVVIGESVGGVISRLYYTQPLIVPTNVHWASAWVLYVCGKENHKATWTHATARHTHLWCYDRHQLSGCCPIPNAGRD